MSGEPRPDHILSIHIAAPVQRVWDEITKTGRIQRALYNTVLESTLRPGGRLRYYSPDRRRVFVIGEILEVDPPRKFVHTYWFTTWKQGGPTVVTWELAEERGGCRVRLIHSGWTSEHEEADATGAGWAQILDLLRAEIETGRLPWKTRAMYWMMGRMAFMLPATTKTEHADRQGW